MYCRPPRLLCRSSQLHLPICFYHLGSSKSCPNCSQLLSTPLPACLKCAYISNIPPNFSYHDMFGLPSKPNPFCIDNAQLKGHFRQAQSTCHPDTWTSKGP